MEEQNRTQQALDELAKLFLTGSQPQSAAPSPQPPAGGSRQTPSQVRADLDALEGPAPIRLNPKPVRSAPVAHHPQHHLTPDGNPHLKLHRDPAGDDADALGEDAMTADGRLDAAVSAAIRKAEQADRDADSSDIDVPEEPAPPAAHVEAVLLGNLPGLAGPWLTQYAQRLALRQGPVAIVHIDDQRIDIERVEPTDQPLAAGRLSPRRPQADAVHSLEGLVSGAAGNPVKRILLHVEPGELAVSLAQLPTVNQWTVVCGSDEAAVLGAYTSIKALVDAEPNMAGKRVGVMVMGATRDAAGDAAEKLMAAAASFLELPLQLVGCQQQMMPVKLKQVGSFEQSAADWQTLCNWLGTLDVPADAVDLQDDVDLDEAAAADAEPEYTSYPDADDHAEAYDADDSFEPALSQTPDEDESLPPRNGWRARRQQVSSHASNGNGNGNGAANGSVNGAGNGNGHTQHADAPARASREWTPQPAAAVAQEHTHASTSPAAAQVASSAPAASTAPVGVAAAVADADEPDLASFLTIEGGSLSGGVALEARCPHQPQTQMVLDSAGRLHLLRNHDRPAAGSAGELPELRAAIVDLLQARNWVAEHLQLLQLTQRQCRFDDATPPMLHLFTDRADLATGLVARLGDTLKLHLLQQIRVGQNTTWFSTPLS